MIIFDKSPLFRKGDDLLTALSAENMSALRDHTVFEIIGGTGEVVPGKGIRLRIPEARRQETRCVVLSGVGSTALSGTLTLDTETLDVPSAATLAKLGALSGSVFTFRTTGNFNCHYCASFEMILDGALTATPGHVIVQSEMRVGGVSLASTSSSTSAALIPNFDGFVVTDGGAELEMTVQDLIVETPVLTLGSFVDCDSITVTGGEEGGYVVGNTCANAITDAELVGGKLQSTPAAGASDVTTNASAITGSLPEGVASGNTSGQALIRVIRNASGVLKILDGATERDPTISLYASVTNGDADCLVATLSITQL